MPILFRALSSRVVDSLAAFTVRRIAPFRAPFKVPFNTVSVAHQATSQSEGPTCDKEYPLRGPDNALEVMNLVDEDEEALPCELFLTRVETWTLMAQILSFSFLQLLPSVFLTMI